MPFVAGKRAKEYLKSLAVLKPDESSLPKKLEGFHKTIEHRNLGPFLGAEPEMVIHASRMIPISFHSYLHENDVDLNKSLVEEEKRLLKEIIREISGADRVNYSATRIGLYYRAHNKELLDHVQENQGIFTNGELDVTKIFENPEDIKNEYGKVINGLFVQQGIWDTNQKEYPATAHIRLNRAACDYIPGMPKEKEEQLLLELKEYLGPDVRDASLSVKYSDVVISYDEADLKKYEPGLQKRMLGSVNAFKEVAASIYRLEDRLQIIIQNPDRLKKFFNEPLSYEDIRFKLLEQDPSIAVCHLDNLKEILRKELDKNSLKLSYVASVPPVKYKLSHKIQH